MLSGTVAERVDFLETPHPSCIRHCGLWRGLLGGPAMLHIFSEHLPAKSLGEFEGIRISPKRVSIQMRR